MMIGAGLALLAAGATFVLFGVTKSVADKGAGATRADYAEVLGLGLAYLGAAICFAVGYPNVKISFAVAIAVVVGCAGYLWKHHQSDEVSQRSQAGQSVR